MRAGGEGEGGQQHQGRGAIMSRMHTPLEGHHASRREGSLPATSSPHHARVGPAEVEPYLEIILKTNIDSSCFKQKNRPHFPTSSGPAEVEPYLQIILKPNIVSTCFKQKKQTTFPSQQKHLKQKNQPHFQANRNI
jgi:hypothetical protein